MKVTFNSIEEEFLHYATIVEKLKEKGETESELFLTSLARATELMKKMKELDVEKTTNKNKVRR